MGRWNTRLHLIQCTTLKKFLVLQYLRLGIEVLVICLAPNSWQPSVNTAKSKGQDVFYKQFLPTPHPGSSFISPGAISRRAAFCEPNLTPSLAQGRGEFHVCAPSLLPMGSQHWRLLANRGPPPCLLQKSLFFIELSFSFSFH